MLRNLFKRENDELPPQIRSIEDFGKFWVVRFQGRLDKTTVPVNKAWSDKYLKEKKVFDKSIIVDLRDVEHVDSAALAMCVLRLTQFKKFGQKLLIINAPEEFKRLAEIERVAKDIQYYNSEKKAIAALKNK